MAKWTQLINLQGRTTLSNRVKIKINFVRSRLRLRQARTKGEKGAYRHGLYEQGHGRRTS